MTSKGDIDTTFSTHCPGSCYGERMASKLYPVDATEWAELSAGFPRGRLTPQEREASANSHARVLRGDRFCTLHELMLPAAKQG